MPTVRSQLKKKIESLCQEAVTTSRLLEAGRKKQITHFQVASYVINLEHLFAKNIEAIKNASEIYKSNSKLSNCFYEKWAEEKGHDAWARADWVKMSKSYKFEKEPSVLPEMKELTIFLEKTMHSNPYRYVAYFYHAEYLTAILGPVWMDMIMVSLGMKKEEVSALSKHIELDEGHAEEVADFMDTLNLTPEQIQDILTFTDELQAKYNLFWDALWRLGNGKRSQRVA